MEDWMKTKLDQSLIELSKCLDINDTILRFRVSNIFDDYDKELVMNESVHKTDFDKRLKIIEILRTRGSKAYWKFCHYIRPRCPQIFKKIHDEALNEKENEVCPVCQPQNDTQSIEKPQCDYCNGLISVFSNFESGVYVEDIEGLVDVFLQKDRIIAKLRHENDAREKEITLLKNDNQFLSERITINLSQIAIKEEELISKERKFAELTASREKLMMEKEEIRINLKESAESIEELNDQLQNYRLKYEEAIKIEEEITKIEEEANTSDPDPTYMNLKKTFWKQKSTQLENEMRIAEQQISSIKKELINERTQFAHLKIQKEAAEELYERVKIENQRVFSSFEEQLKCAQQESVTSQVRMEDLERKINLLQQASDEYALEKDHLVEKLYEKERSLKETKDRLETSLKDYKSLKELYDIKCGNVNTLVGSREDITSQYRAVLNERNAERKKNSELIEAKDDLVHKLIALQRKEEIIQKEMESKQMFVTALEEDCLSLRNKIEQICEIRTGDYEVTLSKTSPTDKFGVSFGVVKGPVRVTESKIVIAAVDYNSKSGPLAGISPGDYVIKINDVCVHDSDNTRIREIEKYDPKNMSLVLRKPRVCSHKLVQLAIHPEVHSSDNVKHWLPFTLVATPKTTYDGWFHPHDEIVQVGGVSAEKLSIEDIYSKISKHIKRRNPLDILVKREREEINQPTPSRRVHRNDSSKVHLSSRNPRHSVRSSVSSGGASDISVDPPPPYQPPGYTTQVSGPLETSEGEVCSISNIQNFLPSVSRQNSNIKPSSITCQSSMDSGTEYRQIESIRRDLNTVAGQLPPQIEPIDSAPPLPPLPQQLISEDRRRSSPAIQQPSTEERFRANPINQQLNTQERRRSNPAPLPPLPPSRDRTEHVNELVFSQGRDNGYTYVMTQKFDKDGNPIFVDCNDYENEMKKIVLRKQPRVDYGFQIVGGNKVGIYIKSVDQWSAAYDSNFEVGWRILKIKDFSMEKVAFCYAIEYLSRLLPETAIEFTFEIIPKAQYEVVLKQKPYDFFHVKALQDYKPQRPQEMPFNKGDILKITNTHVIADPQQPYCWDATKQEGMSTTIKGFVPRQISPLSPTRIQEHIYDQPNQERQNQRPPAPVRAGFYYEILESVGEVLV